ncbi:MAG: ribonuclease III, partial [Streptococcus vestibularis]|nr:ribonuclease III [Streptococcus vestibularis]
EAFLGALYLDQGLPAVEKFLNQVMIPQVEKGNFDRVTDYKTALQEHLQVNGTVDITYTVIDESGPAHAKEFTMQVAVDGKELSTGLGKSKKLAEQAAAKAALEQLGN